MSNSKIDARPINTVQIVMENGLLLTGQIHGKDRRAFPGLVIVMLGDIIAYL